MSHRGLARDGVRPDGFVGWRCDELPSDPEAALRQALSAILCRD
jgi:putative polyketide hydroxylase